MVVVVVAARCGAVAGGMRGQWGHTCAPTEHPAGVGPSVRCRGRDSSEILFIKRWFSEQSSLVTEFPNVKHRDLKNLGLKKAASFVASCWRRHVFSCFIVRRAKISYFCVQNISLRKDVFFHAGKFDAAVSFGEKFPLKSI